ncbi:hypothetical protein C6V82_01715 [Halomonas urumqiensis]|nr:hypothetical protein C6V82_01715 [Halomonas urumqiensis]
MSLATRENNVSTSTQASLDVSIRDQVAVLTLQRPAARNALNTELMLGLADAAERADSDPAVRCLVITGSEGNFAAGADIDELAARGAADGPGDPRVSAWQRLQRLDKPVIAAVEGYCLGGGCELALSADLLVVAEDAKLGQPEIRLGIIPGAGGLHRLAITLGKTRAMHLALTGDTFSGREAFEWGLASQCCEMGQALATAMATANRLTKGAPLAQRLAKRAVLSATEEMHRQGFEMARRSFEVLLSSPDKEEGMRAFREKRKPRFGETS